MAMSLANTQSSLGDIAKKQDVIALIFASVYYHKICTTKNKMIANMVLVTCFLKAFEGFNFSAAANRGEGGYINKFISKMFLVE
jgi:hypothetical protein